MSSLSAEPAGGRDSAAEAHATQTTRRWPRPARFVAGASVVLGLELLVAARRPSGLSEPTIWAEDGAVFMAVAWQGPTEIASVYAGQLWPTQRLLAYLIGFAPPTSWPVVLYLTSALGIALAAAVPLLGRGREVFGRWPYRAAVAVLVAMLPATFEAQGNITNLHWWALGALTVITAMPAPAQRLGKLVELGALALLGLTGPLALFALPVALWRVLAGPRSSRYLWARVGVLAAGAAVIVGTIVSGGRGHLTTAALAEVPGYLYLRWGGSLVLGEARMAAGNVGTADLIAVAGGLVMVIVVVLALADAAGPSPMWLLTGLAVAIAGALAAVGSTEDVALLEPRNLGRYLVPLLLASVFVLVRRLALAQRPWQRVSAAAGLALVLIGTAGDATLPPAGAAVDTAELAKLRPCFDGEAPFADAVACTVEIVPPPWELVIFRPGYESLREDLKVRLSPQAP